MYEVYSVGEEVNGSFCDRFVLDNRNNGLGPTRVSAWIT